MCKISVGPGESLRMVTSGSAASPSPKDFLLSLPRGGYTAARTIEGGRRVLSASFHARRLVESVNLLRRVEPGQVEELVLDVADLQATLEHMPTSLMKASLPSGQAFQDGSELMMTIWVGTGLAGDDDGSSVVLGLGTELAVHICKLPLPPACGYIDCATAVHSRHLPRAKDSYWARDREHLEAVKARAGGAETIMVGQDGRVLEGLVTNVFVVLSDGSVHTAGEDLVLPGHMRAIALEACHKANIPVFVEGPGPVLDATEVVACFVTSAAKPVVPVRRVTLLHTGDGSSPRILEFDIKNDTVLRLAALVAELMLE